MKELVLKYCLQNAVFYNGKANAGAVLGKVLAENPNLRKRVTEVRKEIEKTVKKVNALSLDEQKNQLEAIDKKLLVRETKKQEELPPLRNAKRGKVITRFAPSPTGPLSLPHLLRAAMLSYLYAKMYNGRFILRFEDTDPKNIRPDFYDWIKDDMKRCGVKPDKVVKESDNMRLYYRFAEDLIKKGIMYVCSCPVENFREIKNKRQPCPCRDRSDIKEWKKMLSGDYAEGNAVVRLKTSMKDPNPALRDPVMLRVSKVVHPMKKKKYNVWPLYNFANVVDDHNEGVTHIFRGKEHEHNTAIQKVLYDALGWKQPVVINFGMIYLPGEKLHTRDIKEGIKTGRYSGWDDPRLPTVRSLLRRGFQPETFRQCAIGCGLSKTDIRFSWATLDGTNRKIIDPMANRYMVVLDPVQISVKGAPEIKSVEESLHPDFPKRGERKMPVDTKSIYIARDDYRNLKGRTFRLKSLGNIRLGRDGRTAKYAGNEIDARMQKVQWVSIPNVKVRVVTPDGELEGLGEQSMNGLRPGNLIQMERTGFGRVDAVSRNEVTVYFAHK